MAILDKIVQEFKNRFFETVKLPVQVHSSSGDFPATWEGIEGTALSFTLDRFHPDPAEGTNAVIEIKVPFWKDPLLFSGKLLDKKVVRSKSPERITDTVLVFESELSDFLKKNLPKIDLTLPKK
ncbi:hypothetical protein EHQ53_02050 [Leptospira langatensis]|uniref:Uncharacterized protein n=1 Tax=Leptospira langatensis TaxID=2484983 RepID=A0A5F1ZX58_9LEPT|nr:hypothetical protein [Leptospira langatensis]TGJ98527.1 hypothetical protein EHO57_18190 [Leptospira langatensis]TGL43442.1 hypothetical protein EHQ53_02050 [Leptospira langatensis]